MRLRVRIPESNKLAMLLVRPCNSIFEANRAAGFGLHDITVTVLRFTIYPLIRYKLHQIATS